MRWKASCTVHCCLGVCTACLGLSRSALLTLDVLGASIRLRTDVDTLVEYAISVFVLFPFMFPFRFHFRFVSVSSSVSISCPSPFRFCFVSVPFPSPCPHRFHSVSIVVPFVVPFLCCFVLCDFVGTGCFYLLFQVSAWPNVKTRKNTYKVHNITVKSCKHQVKNHLKSK